MASSAWQSKGRVIGLDSSGIPEDIFLRVLSGRCKKFLWPSLRGSRMSLLPHIPVKQVTKSVQIQEMRNQTPLLNGSRRKKFVAHFNLSLLVRETSQGRMAHSAKHTLKKDVSKCQQTRDQMSEESEGRRPWSWHNLLIGFHDFQMAQEGSSGMSGATK